MKRSLFLTTFATTIAVSAYAQPLTNAITYQGKLENNNVPANGLHDIQLQLYRTPSGNQQVGPTLCFDNINVVDGLFTVAPDFGAVFDGTERFLSISVRTDAVAGNCTGGSYSPLNPRQPITAAPYALKVPGIDGNSLNAADGSPVDALFVDNVGNVGIGTTVPTSALHVKGNGNIFSLEGTDHFFLGFYPDGLAAGRKGYLGYVAPANNDLHLVSEAAGSSLQLIPGTSGNIYVGTSAIPSPLVFPNTLGNKISLWGGTSGSHYGLGIQSGALQIYSNGPGANVSFGHGSSANFVEHMRIAGNGRVGIGTMSPQQMLDVNGTARVRVLEIIGADLAEKFPTSDKVEPGMVVAIDPTNAGKLCLARGAYNRCVAGVVSGGNNFSVGAVLGHLPGNEDAPPIALSGRVYVWCDASSGAIEPGDLLTTSETPGHAMKATEREQSHGAVIGKAMERLESGRGLVLVLVNLQ